MSFLSVVRQREDGDFDAIAAFHYDHPNSRERALQVLEYDIFENGEGVKIIHIENVTDVIESEYVE